jgi:uncharacterized protein with HEPN domain
MPSDRTRDALDAIAINIDAIAEFTEGLTYETFRNDRLHTYAVTRALEIISEASRRLPDDLMARHPDVQWRSIRDAGNVYRHKYSQVSDLLIWQTAIEQLGLLQTAVARELGAFFQERDTCSDKDPP